MTNKGDLTRQNIIDNSLQLFSVKGFYNTSINDIMETTGLTKGGLYAHFGSKEDIWYSVYDMAVRIWKDIVFKNTKDVKNPLERLEKLIVNDIKLYLGGNVFEGGCFFLNMLVELSGQSPTMSKHILQGFIKFSRLIKSWLSEAQEKGILKDNLNLKEISNFIVITLNGAAAIYASSRDAAILNQTVDQLRFYLNQLKK